MAAGTSAPEKVEEFRRTLHGTILEPPDLLWALKGRGGNFGVVTSFEFRLHPVGLEVYFLLTFYAASEAATVLEFFRSFMPEAPDELMAIAIYWNAPEGEPIPEEHRGAPVMVVVGCWCGRLDEGERATRPLRQIATLIADVSGPMPYVEAQRLFDPDYPKGRRYYWKSLYPARFERRRDSSSLRRWRGASHPDEHRGGVGTRRGDGTRTAGGHGLLPSRGALPAHDRGKH
jgi:FAD/FMN-containing dehydrogenase